MCRWIIYLGSKPLLLQNLLIDAPHPITKQISTHYLPDNPEGAGPAMYNFDGYGTTWYTDIRSQFDPDVKGILPSRYRTTEIAATSETFANLCANNASTCILAHVRAATGPPVVWSSNHPFIFGRHSFMHNGWIVDFQRIRLQMLQKTSEEYRALIFGNTDTEHFAALYFTCLGDASKKYSAKQMQIALVKAMVIVNDLQREILGAEQENQLNFCATDGESLVALRWMTTPLLTPAPNLPLSLYVSFTAAASLDGDTKAEYSKQHATCSPAEIIKGAEASPACDHLDLFTKSNPHGPHVIVASEPATFNADEWYSLRNGQFVLVDNLLTPPIFEAKPGHDDGPNRNNNDEKPTHDDSPKKPIPFAAVNKRWGVKVSFEDLDPNVLKKKD